MALTIAPVTNPYQFHSVGNLRAVFADVTLDTSYPTGGYSLTPQALGFGNFIGLLIAAPNSGLLFEYLHATNLLKAWYPTGGASSPGSLAAPAVAAPTATLANAVVPAGATAVTSSAAQPTLTITQPTISTPALTGGQGREVANATNLSTVTTRVFALGY